MVAITNPTVVTVISPPKDDFEELRSRVRGEVVTPDVATYDEVRAVHVRTYAGRPGAIVRATGESDVIEAVRFAKESGRPLAIRSGGHSITGASSPDGELVLDLSQMREIHIDAGLAIARVQAGANSGDLVEKARPYGLALSTGDTASVGLGGLTTGGGIGFMARRYGLAIDNLISARVVTANGEAVTASAVEHPDLFWAIRGGGGNFGIVTEFVFQLARVGHQVIGGAIILPGTKEVIRGYLDYAESAPEDLTTIADLMFAPPAPFVPEERVGEQVLFIMGIWTGDHEDADDALAPLRALAEPIADTMAPMAYADIYEYTRDLEQPHRVAIRSMFADEHGGESIDTILQAMSEAPGPASLVMFRWMGGQVARVGEQETAFAHRTQALFTTFISLWEEGEDSAPHHAWANGLFDSISHEARGVYVNFLAHEGEERIRDAYPQQTYDRLVRVKRAYDPTNMFKFNQNIRP